ncbi:hypothetical protein B0181_09770 [Moraxella caviae]|uniref:Uncharacterized protein n=1 Tax=Moraxella caviae TaxID=34060 RepID=A0A1S9ZWC6_9GAMM|nr:hypothetical protein [Moraxella caviae]OOR87733.1 hypothetical protein B0181_09770 [Moraxella caviae]STZ10146.1 Uncharacterised protein [Moraxella caviae]
MKLPTKEQINTAITTITFVLLMVFGWRLYSSGYFDRFSYDARNYDKQEDRPSIEQLTVLLNEITHGLPTPTDVNETNKTGVVSVNYKYLNLTNTQKSQLAQNVQVQSKWVFQRHKENKYGHSDEYCFNQFELIIDVEVFDFQILKKDSGEYTSVYISWWKTGECRLAYFQNQ